MSLPVAMFFARNASFIALAGMAVGIVVGAIKTVVELLYGHSFLVSLKVGSVFFLIAFGCIFIGTMVPVSVQIISKSKRLGLTLDQICRLPEEERKKFRAENGF
jgi:hypothetical protein